MVGDTWTALSKFLNQCFCKHDYRTRVQKGLVGIPYQECKKCGRVK